MDLHLAIHESTETHHETKRATKRTRKGLLISIRNWIWISKEKKIKEFPSITFSRWIFKENSQSISPNKSIINSLFSSPRLIDRLNRYKLLNNLSNYLSSCGSFFSSSPFFCLVPKVTLFQCFLVSLHNCNVTASFAHPVTVAHLPCSTQHLPRFRPLSITIFIDHHQKHCCDWPGH